MGLPEWPGDDPQHPADTAGGSILGCLTIPGRPEHVQEARAFVAKILGGQGRSPCEVAVLLTSEIVTNAIVHTNSSRPGGTVTLVVAEAGGGLRITVEDSGSDLGTPVVRDEVFTDGGHGMFLVEHLADRWGYLRGPYGTAVWFWLREPTAA
ncbi:MAG: ATP-binding protein [Streptosporangiaceae bacterium]